MLNFKKYFLLVGLIFLLGIGYFSFKNIPEENKTSFGQKINPSVLAGKIASPSTAAPSGSQNFNQDFPVSTLKTTSSFDGTFSKIKADSLGVFHQPRLPEEIDEFLKNHPSILSGYPQMAKDKISINETPFFLISNYSFKWHGLPYPGTFKFFFKKGNPLVLEEIQNTLPVLEKFNDCEEHSRNEVPEILQNFYADEKIKISKITERKIITSSAKTGIIGVDVHYKTKKGNFLVTIGLCDGEMTGLPHPSDFH